jgi:hypothetical protein
MKNIPSLWEFEDNVYLCNTTKELIEMMKNEAG